MSTMLMALDKLTQVKVTAKPNQRTDSLACQVYAIVAMIPRGSITTYGEIARRAGMPSYARQVGFILRQLPKESTLPWFRVINRQGKISLTGARYQQQKQRLLDEGILFTQYDSISLTQYGWK